MTHPPDLGLAPERHDDWYQLVHASLGVMRVHTEEGAWIVPPHRAIWIPAGETYEVDMSGRVSLRTLFFDAELVDDLIADHEVYPPPLAECRAINVPPLLRELVLHACRLNVLFDSEPAHVRLAGVILDQLEAVDAAPLQLPMPRDERACRAAELMLASSDPVAVIARAAGASPRTLERLFRRETSMTIGRWRQRARLVEAVRLLAAGTPVTEVALDVGYNSPSAFIAAFRAQLGTTPSRFFEPRTDTVGTDG